MPTADPNAAPPGAAPGSPLGSAAGAAQGPGTSAPAPSAAAGAALGPGTSAPAPSAAAAPSPSVPVGPSLPASPSAAAAAPPPLSPPTPTPAPPSGAAATAAPPPGTPPGPPPATPATSGAPGQAGLPEALPAPRPDLSVPTELTVPTEPTASYPPALLKVIEHLEQADALLKAVIHDLRGSATALAQEAVTRSIEKASAHIVRALRGLDVPPDEAPESLDVLNAFTKDVHQNREIGALLHLPTLQEVRRAVKDLIEELKRRGFMWLQPEPPLFAAITEQDIPMPLAGRKLWPLLFLMVLLSVVMAVMAWLSLRPD